MSWINKTDKLMRWYRWNEGEQEENYTYDPARDDHNDDKTIKTSNKQNGQAVYAVQEGLGRDWNQYCLSQDYSQISEEEFDEFCEQDEYEDQWQLRLFLAVHLTVN